MAVPSRFHKKTKKGAGSKFFRGKKRMSPAFARKTCRFCTDKIAYIDYKAVNVIRNFVSERGKILSAGITGVCAKHQRQLTTAVKRARNLALLPFSVVY